MNPLTGTRAVEPAHLFAGTGPLLRLALRRDRIQLPIWLVALATIQAATANSMQSLYATPEARETYVRVASSNVVSRAFNGLVSGPSLGSITATETFLIISILTALMSIATVVRHTRQNEETGRAEMIESGVAGRFAALTAAVLVAVGANVVLVGLLGTALAVNGLPIAGSFAEAAAVGAVGVSFASVAAVTAQLADHSRSANALAAAVLGIAFMLCAVGNAVGTTTPDGMSMISAWPAWLSPLGWSQQLRPYAECEWPVLGLSTAWSAVSIVAAYVLTARRDLGMGMMPVRRGRPTAGRWLSGPLGLAWRQQRGVILAWTIALGTACALFGSITTQVRKIADEGTAWPQIIEQLGGEGEIEDAFIASMLGLCALGVGAFVVQSLVRARVEEAAGRAEPVLATAVSRSRWLAANAAVSGLGCVTLLLITGITTGLAYGLVADDVPGKLVSTTGAALLWLPAPLALGGFVLAAFGIGPRGVIPLAWGGLALCLLLGQIGALLELPQAVLNVSPFTHVPALPGGDLALTPLAGTSAVAAGLGTAGLLAFGRRDINA